MQIPVIKKLVEQYSLEQLRAAEEAIGEERKADIEIEGVDAGEQLTHAYAAIWILEKMDSDGLPFNKALREFTQKVRNSIS